MSYASTSPNPITLGDGRMVAFGEPVGRLDAKNETNRRLIEAGTLIEIKPKPKSKSQEEK